MKNNYLQQSMFMEHKEFFVMIDEQGYIIQLAFLSATDNLNSIRRLRYDMVINDMLASNN